MVGNGQSDAEFKGLLKFPPNLNLPGLNHLDRFGKAFKTDLKRSVFKDIEE